MEYTICSGCEMPNGVHAAVCPVTNVLNALVADVKRQRFQTKVCMSILTALVVFTVWHGASHPFKSQSTFVFHEVILLFSGVALGIGYSVLRRVKRDLGGLISPRRKMKFSGFGGWR